MTKSRISALIISAMTIGIAVILAVMPFHAALTVVAGVYGRSFSLAQIWKDIIIALLEGGLIALALINRKLPIKFDIINILALSFVALSLIVSYFGHLSLRATLVGFKTDCMMLVLFLASQIRQSYFSRQKLAKFILIPAILVAIMAVAQSIYAPIEILSRFGYGPGSINPVQIVDGSLGLLRAFSTLGGPNQLGAYMIAPIILALCLLIQKRQFIFAAVLPVLLAALILSYSRSAWIGLIIGLFVAILLLIPPRYRMAYIAIALVACLAGGLVVAQIIGPGKVTKLQNVLLHGRNFNDQIQGSDQSRISVMAKAGADIIHHPIGFGLGAAGPASQQLPSPRITENWFLQIGLETGILGLFIMLAMLLFIIWELVRMPVSNQSYLNISLTAGLIGVMISGLFLHSLADSTLAYVLFAILGLNRRLIQ